MVSSRNTPDEWTIPGGGLEPNEDPRDTAAREAMEEVRSSTQLICMSTITYCFLSIRYGVVTESCVLLYVFYSIGWSLS